MSVALYAFMLLRRFLPLVVAALAVMGCGGSPGDDGEDGNQGFTSAQSTLVAFEFDAELLATPGPDADKEIRAQLLYTLGPLQLSEAAAQVGDAAITNVQTSAGSGGLSRVTYHVKLPVAWPANGKVPPAYVLVLPRTITSADLEAFAVKYRARCADSAHVTADDMFQHFQPGRSACTLLGPAPAPADVVRVTATVTPAPPELRPTFPEYDQIWSDDVLDVVAVYGKDVEASQSNSDEGIEAYNHFVASVRKTLAAYAPRTTPPGAGDRPGVANPDVTIEATLPGGRRVVVHALLVGQLATAPPSFDARYDTLTEDADLIVYDGHSGYGKNARAFTNKGKFKAGKYVVLFVNACNTFAYLDRTLAARRALLNPGDPNGTRFMDSILNVMTAPFDAPAEIPILRALMDRDHPKSYRDILKSVDNVQRAVVIGDEDNTFGSGSSSH